jgi:photosynthetic reaction center H subunit
MKPHATPDGPGQTDRRRREQNDRQPEGPDSPLAELRHLTDYTIADGNPDIRGWAVRTAASFGDRIIGTVEDLVVDADTLRVRYLLICLHKDAVATTRDRRVLVPVGIGRLDENEDQLRLDGYTIGHLVGIPEFRPGKLTRHYETTVRRRFGPPGPRGGPRDRRPVDFYDYPEFDDRSLWAGRDSRHAAMPYLERHGRVD